MIFVQFFFLEVEAQGMSTMELLYSWAIPTKDGDLNFNADGGNFASSNGVKFRFPVISFVLQDRKLWNEFTNGIINGKEIGGLFNEYFSEKIGKNFDCAKISTSSKYVQRPRVWYSDQEGRNLYLSPTPETGVWCESVFCLDKVYVLNTGLIEKIVEHLKCETGIDFTSIDAGRLGNLEYFEYPLVCPVTVNQKVVESESGNEKACQTVCIEIAAGAFNTPSELIVRVSLENAHAIILDECKAVKLVNDEAITLKFDAEENISGILVGLWEKCDDRFVLVYEKNFTLIREVSVTMGIMAYTVEIQGEQKIDKLAKGKNQIARKAIDLRKARYKSSNRTFNVNPMRTDSWRSVSRSIISQMALLFPAASKSIFFNKGFVDNGAVEFRKWLKNIVVGCPASSRIVIIDPYFDDAGIHALLQMEELTHKYVVVLNSGAVPESQKRLENVNKVLASTEIVSQNKSIEIFDVSNTSRVLHDRYLMISNSEEDFVLGFQLSNSIQKASENFPLLVTEIPKNVISSVQNYVSELLSAPGVISIWPIDTVEKSEKSEGKDVSFEDIRAMYDSLQKISSEEFAAKWQDFCTGVANCSEAELWFHDECTKLKSNDCLISKVREFIVDFNFVGIAKKSKVTIDDFAYLDVFRDNNYIRQISNAKQMVKYPRRNYTFTNWGLYYGLEFLIWTLPSAIDEFVEKVLNSNADKCDCAIVINMVVFSLAEQFYHTEVTFEYTDSKFAIIRAMAISSKFYSPLEMSCGSVKDLNYVKKYLQKYDTSEQIIALCEWVYDLRVIQNRNGESEKVELLIGEIFDIIISIWPSSGNKDLLEHIVGKCGGPLKGSWGVDTANKLIVPLLRLEKVLFPDIEKIWYVMWVDSITNEHAHMESLHELNSLMGWVLANAPRQSVAAYIDELRRKVKGFSKDVRHPLAFAINFKAASYASDMLLKYGAFLAMANFELQKVDNEELFAVVSELLGVCQRTIDKYSLLEKCYNEPLRSYYSQLCVTEK